MCVVGLFSNCSPKEKDETATETEEEVTPAPAVPAASDVVPETEDDADEETTETEDDAEETPVTYECSNNTNKTTCYKLVEVVGGHGLKALISGSACSNSEDFTLAEAPTAAPNVGVDLSGLDLSTLDLTGVDLTGVIVSVESTTVSYPAELSTIWLQSGELIFDAGYPLYASTNCGGTRGDESSTGLVSNFSVFAEGTCYSLDDFVDGNIEEYATTTSVLGTVLPAGLDGFTASGTCNNATCSSTTPTTP